MFTTIRKHQRWLMLVIAILTVIAFAFLYNTTDLDRVGVNTVARIYGRTVMQVDVERALRNYQLSIALGQIDLVRSLAAGAKNENEAAENFIWNLMVLQHEAAALGVEPGRQAVVDRIKALPVFQTGGVFDPMKYSAFVQEQLAPRGFTERQLEMVIRDVLRLESVRSLTGVPAVLFKDQVEAIRTRLAPLDVSVIRFSPAAGVPAVEVSDEELKSAFEAGKETLRMPEKRSVRYVAFVLPEGSKDAKDRARIEALQKLSTETGDFVQALGDGTQSLEAASRARGFEMRLTPLFAKDGRTSGTLEGLDKEIVSAAAEAAFRLSAPGALEIVQLGQDGYAVVELAQIEAGRPLAFEEAAADLRAGLIETKRLQSAREAAEKALTAVRENLAGGQTLAEAAEKAGVVTEEIKGLSLLSENLTPAHRRIMAAALDSSVGTLGKFIPDTGGGFAVYVEKRGEPDAALLARNMPMIEEGVLAEKRMLLFAQWLVTARNASGLQVLRSAM